jgi:hypothetical protein
MNYRSVIEATARNGYRNLVGTLVVSVLLSLAVLPLGLATVVQTPLAVLAGLWASCLFVGLLLVGAFSFTITVAERGVPIAVLPELRSALNAPKLGLTVGGATFVVILTSIAAVVLTPPVFRDVGVGVAGFLLVDWYLLVGFASPEIAGSESLRSALAASVERALQAPAAAAFFILLSFVCVLVAGATLVTIVFILPSGLCLMAAHVTIEIDADRS